MSSAPWRRADSRKPFRPVTERASPPGGGTTRPGASGAAGADPAGTARRRRVPTGVARAMMGFSDIRRSGRTLVCRADRSSDELVFGAHAAALDRDLARVLEAAHGAHDLALRLLDDAPAHGAHELHVLPEHLGGAGGHVAEDLLLDLVGGALQRQAHVLHLDVLEHLLDGPV